MRTILFVVSGLVLGALIVVGGRAIGVKAASAYGAFLVAWLAIAAFNLYQGVATAGYTVLEELPIFLVIVLVPAVLVRWLVQRTG